MINGVNSYNYSSQLVHTYESKTETQTADRSTEESGVILDIGGSNARNAVYKKPSGKLNAEEINRLWEQTQKATEHLRALVEKLIEKQGKKVGDILSGKEVLIVDAETRAEAEKMISEDGEWGVEAVSSRIVDFAKAVSGGDTGKLEELKSAIKKGFEQAGAALGGSLPDISKKTYDAIMKKLDEWGNEESQENV